MSFGACKECGQRFYSFGEHRIHKCQTMPVPDSIKAEWAKQEPINPGAILRARRLELGFSLRSVAGQCELSPTMLTGIENGHQKPGVNAAHRLFTALALPLRHREAIVGEWAAEVYHHAELWQGVAGGSRP